MTVMAGPVIAVYGGSFDPPHLAHQMACLVALEAAAVDEIWLVPTYRHMFGKNLIAYEHRLAMCHLLARPFGDRARVSTVERDLGGDTNPMLSTLQALADQHPDHRFRLLIGSDILAERHLWYAWDQVTKLAPPLLLARLGAPVPDDWQAIGPPLPDVSSSEVRHRLATGQDASALVPRSVLDYIAGAGLYR